MSFARATTAVMVLAGAVAMAVLPVLVALGLAPGEVIRVVAGAGTLFAVVGGVKFGVVAWSLVRGVVRPAFQTASASVD